MGFGYIFLGSLFTVNYIAEGFTDVFAFALMLIGISHLVSYAKGFSLSFRIGIPLVAVSFVSFVLSILRALSVFSTPTFVFTAITIVSLVCKAFFYWFFFSGVYEVAREADIPKLKRHAPVSRALTPIVFTVLLFCKSGIVSPPTEAPGTSRVLFIALFVLYLLIEYGPIIFGIVFALINCKTIFECYILICYEGDEDMEAPTHSPFRRKKGDGEQVRDRKEKK